MIGRESSATAPRRLRRVTTIRPALDAAARAAIAARTEALFRALRRAPRGPLPAQERPPRRRLRREVRRSSQDPAATSELCGFWAARRPRPRRRADGRPRRRPDDRRRHPRLRDRPPARGPQHLRRGGPRRRRRDPARVPARLPIEPGERVLLVDDILTTGGSLLAMIPAVEAMGGEIVECAVLVDRSGGRDDADVADDRPGLPAPRALAARPADLRAGPGRPVRAARPATPLHAPGSSGDRRLIRVDRRTRNVFAVVLVVVIGRDRRRGADPRRRRRPRRRAARRDARPSIGVVVAGRRGGRSTDVAGFTLRTTPAGRSRRSASARSRTASSSRRATSPSTRRPRRRSASGSERRRRPTLVAFRLEDAPTSGPRPPAPGVDSARDRRLRARPSVDDEPRTSRGRCPSPSTTKIHGSDRGPSRRSTSVAWSWPFASRTGWSWPVDVLRAGTARR